ncbi:MAG: hypothetical protein ACE5OR_03360 [bacterium]
MLEEYRDELSKELEGVEEGIEELGRSLALDGGRVEGHSHFKRCREKKAMDFEHTRPLLCSDR